MPTVTINIANRGTQLSDGGESKVGHMWYALDDGKGTVSSYGFSPDIDHEGSPFASGQVNAHGSDNDHYLGDRYYSREIEISEAQYNAMKQFGEAGRLALPDQTIATIGVDGVSHSFELHYNGLTNSCIDFTWAAMQVGGLNPSGFQGAVWPTWNKTFADQTIDAFLAQQGNGNQAGTSIVDDSQGNKLTIVSDGSGNVRYTWQTEDGQSGINTHNADGSGTSDIFDADGHKVADTWQKSDGTYGSDSFNPLDGSSSGIAYNADGSHSTYTYTENQGYVDASFYDAQGNAIGGQCLTFAETTTPIFTASTTSLAATLNTTQTLFEAEQDAALSAHEVRSFVGLETLLPGETSSAWFDSFVDLADLLPVDADTQWSVDYGAIVDSGQDDWTYVDTSWDAGGSYTDYTDYTNYDGVADYSDYYADNAWYDYGGDFGGWDTWAPVVLDLDGDGIELVAESDSHAWFDVTGDGTRHRTGWVGQDDGLLAIDDNGNGKIDSGHEVAFSSWTTATDTDLAALAAVFDTNHDGRLNAADTRFGAFRLWQDANGNGESDAGELKTLAAAGITAINLTPTKVDYHSGGNQLAGFATFDRANGTHGWAGDVAFGYDDVGYTSSVQSGYVKLSQQGGLSVGVSTSATINLNLALAGLNGAVGGAGGDTLVAGSGAQGVMLEGGAGNDALTGGAKDDWLSGGAGADKLFGGAGNDTLVIDARDLPTNIDGGSGFDVAVVGSATGITLDMSAAHLEAAVGNEGNDDFRFTEESNVRMIVSGHGGDDAMDGNIGNDLLEGGTGNDSLYGGLGDDLYVFGKGDGADLITDQWWGVYQWSDYYNDWLLFEHTLAYYPELDDGWYYASVENNAGYDTLEFGAGIATTDLDAESIGDDLVIGIRDWSKPGGSVLALADHVTLKDWWYLDSTIEKIRFADGTTEDMNNWQFGGAGNDALVGRAGSVRDRIFGGGGNDTLNGGAGADWLIGGTGNDSYVVDNVGDWVMETGSAGTDAVTSAVAYALGANLENLVLSGTLAIDGTGNALNNSLRGNSAANRLDGGAGVDALIGGVGNDIYIVDNVGDAITELVNEGRDTVISSVSWTLGNNLENLTLKALAAINGTGNGLNNALTGNMAKNILNGGIGADTMKGGDGSDTYYIDNLGDVVAESNATASTGGTDLVNSYLSATALNANVENIRLLSAGTANGTGNTLNNVLYAGVGNNVLDGQSGTDTASYLYATAGVTANLMLTGAQATGGSGSDKFINIENLTGSNSNDKLTGNTANNALNGGLGADTLVGGQGNDTYFVDNIGDVVTENASQGTDAALSSITYTLGANLENLTLTGTAAINGTGNELNNRLTGNLAANVLNGGAGANTLTGGDGSDTYYVSNTGDLVIESNAIARTGGTDKVCSYLSSYTLGSNVENGRIMATGTANLTGNGLGNTLYAGTGGNVLNGGSGIDTASYAFASGAVTVSLALATAQATGGSGTDTLTAIENLAGSNYADNLIGNAAANVLTGGTGQDTLRGGAGNDTFDFNALAETGLTSTTRDVIVDFMSGLDKIDLAAIDANAATTTVNEAFSFIGAAAFGTNATGQLRYVYDSATATVLLYGSTDADSAAEFAIQLNGVSRLATADFVL